MKVIIKFFAIFLLFISSFSFFSVPAQACMGFSCKADLIILGIVTSKKDTLITVQPFHVFPDSQNPVEGSVLVEDKNEELKLGKKYALSLNKLEDQYTLNWDLIEIEGDSFENARLKKLDTGDDALWQLWINNNGQMPKMNYFISGQTLFGGIGVKDGPFYREVQIYPNESQWSSKNLLLSLSGFALGVLSVFLIRSIRKK